MRRLSLFAVAAVTAFLGYEFLGGSEDDSPAVKVYREFSDAWAGQDLERAARLSIGEAHRLTEDEDYSVEIMGYRVAPPKLDVRLEGSRFEIESVEYSEGGNVARIVARHAVSISSTGHHANPLSPSSYTTRVETATARKTAAGWMVSEFRISD